MLQLIAIQTKDCVYISTDIEGRGLILDVNSYTFDGIKAETTYINSWLKISKIPKIIKKIVYGGRANIRYELKPEYPETDKTPKIIKSIYIDDDNDYNDVIGLYEYKYDELPQTYEQIEFQITVLDSIKNFEPIKSEFKLTHNLLDRLSTHPILLTEKYCRLSPEETYKIIRNYVKLHINPKYAKITSDYDFCFSVKKVFQLVEPIEYTIDINAYSFKKRKPKPKYEKRYRDTREVKILDIAPKPYHEYNVVVPFEGKNYKDLKSNIDKYLKDLMLIINEPLKDCPNCKGCGYVYESTK